MSDTTNQSKQFYDTFLKISNSLTGSLTRQELLRSILQGVKPLFNYHSAGLFVVYEKEDYHIDLTAEDPEIEPSNINFRHQEKGNVKMKHEGSSVQYSIQQAKNTNGVVLLDFVDLFKRFPDYPQFQVIKNDSYRDCLVGLLQFQGNTLGMFCLNAKEKNFFPKEKFELFRLICEQLAIAVSNILYKEEIEQREQEKTRLLALSEPISKVRNRKELLQIIYNQIREIFPFDDTGLFTLNETGEHHIDWIVEDEITEDGAEILEEGITGYLPHKDSVVEGMMQDVPTLFHFEEINQKHPGHPQYTLMKRQGIKQFISRALFRESKKIGMLCFNSKQEGFYTEKEFRVFDSIANQINVAVLNVLANEEIKQREQEKTDLLKISEAIASVKSREDLLKAMLDRIKPLVDYQDAVITIYESDYTQYRHFISSSPKSRKKDAQYHEIMGKSHNLKGTPDEYVLKELRKTGILFWETKAMKEKYPKHFIPDFLEEHDLRHNLYLRLIWNNELIGFLHFHFNEIKKADLSKSSFYQSIADQLSATVANIIANEQILEEKKLTETLLSISEGITTIRSKKELLSYIVEKLKPIFGFYDTGILVLDKEKKQYTDWSAFYKVDDSPTNLGIFEHYENQTTWNPYPGSGVELAITESNKTAQPILFDWDKDWSHLSDAKIMSFLKNHAYDRSMVYPFKNGNKLLGAFWINFRKKDDINRVSKPLFQGISDQLAVTISNILANEEIERRERLKSLQVEAVTIFNKDKNWDERFEEFIKALQPHIPFHFVSIDLWDNETDYNRCKNIERIGSNEYRLWGPDDFERASGIPKKESSSAYSIVRNWHFEGKKKPVAQSKAHKTILKILNKIMDIEQHVDLSIQLQDNRRFLLSLYKKGAALYTPEQTTLLQELKGTLGQTIEKALITEKVKELNQQLVEEKAYLQEEVKETYGFEEIVGESIIMQKVFEKVSEVSSINATVLILGETGTGKELIARAIHNNSPRKDRVLVKVNCAAIPSQIVESELFGHEKGAFTGAIKQRIGKFELANHGTIFLDEIGDMPMELQAKLLRVLQEREVERVGSNIMIKLDFRVIAATNKDLAELVRGGKFRADLFYRLNTFPLYLPALRERENDAVLLAKHFARQLSQSLGLPFKGFNKKSLHNISNYEWPGNVRELQNVIEQAIILQKGKKLDISPHRTEKLVGSRSVSASLREIPDEFDMDYINAQKENLEKEYLLHILEKTKWRVRGKSGAAELLDIHPNTLDYYLKRLGISKK